jgi:hypothetical protein
LGDAGNGIGELFAKKIRVEQVCVGTSGNETCVDKNTLDQLLQSVGGGAQVTTPSGSSGSDQTSETEISDTQEGDSTSETSTTEVTPADESEPSESPVLVEESPGETEIPDGSETASENEVIEPFAPEEVVPVTE